MKSQSSCSEDQGFYKPSIQITQPTPILTEFASINYNNQQAFDDAIDIITEDRPVDFIPRFLSTTTTYFKNLQILDQLNDSANGEYMQCLTGSNKAKEKQIKEGKQKKYLSLQAKYKNNQAFQLVYSKIPQNSQFSSYIFSLQNTPDYNPNDFETVSTQTLPKETLFDSHFESGNLLYAYRKKATNQYPQYDLILQNDTNTNGYSQWFYFCIHNQQCLKMKINIVNFVKKNLMFVDGVRPIAFSIKQNQRSKKGWYFIGDNITYGRSYVARQIAGNPVQYKNLYCLTFDIDLTQKNDRVYIALNFPYTYTRMIKHIQKITMSCPQSIQIKRQILCHTISNNPIPYLIIQNRQSQIKKTILCLGRQHPGETVGSYVLQSFINNILINEQLLEMFRFIIVPMINPDGVIYGNFRTNLAGFDLNRQWKQPNRWLHPQVFFLNKLIAGLENVQFCMDFHGHSKKMNTFIYACVNQKISDFRLYPYIFSQNCDLFSLKDCTYSITPDKMKTARINVFNQLKKPYIFTLQTSFFGHTKENKFKRFTLTDFELLGKAAVKSLQTLLIDKKAVTKFQSEVKDKSYLFQQWAMQNREDDGSDSNPSQDELTPVQRKNKVMSDIKAKKPYKRKGKKSKRSKSPKKKKQIYQYILRQKADSAILLQNKKSDKKTPVNIKMNDNNIILIQDSAKKLKSEVRKQISQNYLQPKIKPPPPVIQRPQQIKTMGPNAERPKIQKAFGSNLFDTANYFKLRQQITNQMKKSQEQKLQIISRRQQFALKEKSSRHYSKNQNLKKQTEQLPIYSQPKKKSRERVYVIKQNKVVSSITRVNQQQMRRNIQKQISHRTMALKNCQKIMNNFSIDKPKSVDRSDFFGEEDPYKTRKLLKPLDIRRHRNFNSFKDQQRAGVFFSFLEN